MIYQLRDPNYTIPTETVKMIAEPSLVNPFVDLKADRGIRAQLMQEIRDLAAAFDQPTVDQFCKDYNVTEERHKKALSNLLQVLKKSDLELVDKDAGVVMPVNRVH